MAISKKGIFSTVKEIHDQSLQSWKTLPSPTNADFWDACFVGSVRVSCISCQELNIIFSPNLFSLAPPTTSTPFSLSEFFLKMPEEEEREVTHKGIHNWKAYFMVWKTSVFLFAFRHVCRVILFVLIQHSMTLSNVGDLWNCLYSTEEHYSLAMRARCASGNTKASQILPGQFPDVRDCFSLIQYSPYNQGQSQALGLKSTIFKALRCC